MYTEWLLRAYELGPGERLGLKLSYRGSPRYADVLQAAFPPPVRWYGPYEAFDQRYDGILYIQRDDEDRIRDFLAFASETLLFPTTLDECWALSGHMEAEGRSEVGELVYRAKTYVGKLGDRVAAQELSARISEQFGRHPRIRSADVIIGIPANPPKEPHNLPEVLAEDMAKTFGASPGHGILIKRRPTQEIKNLTDADKLAALEGAYEVTADLQGANVVIVDDLVFSGSTLNYVGQLLRERGAGSTIGVVATKTRRT